MKTVLFLALSIASVAFAGQTRTVMVGNLSSAEFDTVGSDDTLKIAFGSGGCSPTDHKIGYNLTLVSKKTRITPPDLKQLGGIGKTTEAVVKIEVTETVPDVPADCAMAFEMKDTVSLTKLLKDNSVKLGLNVGELDADTEVEWVLATPLNGATSIANFPPSK